MGTLQVGGTTLGVKNTSTNKIDLSNSNYKQTQNRIFISALTGEGIENLKDRIERKLT